jgi:hypothetical protein
MYLFIVNIPVSVLFSLFYYPFNCPIFYRILFVYVSFVVFPYIFVSLECIWQLCMKFT